MQDTLKNHDSTISIGGRPISNIVLQMTYTSSQVHIMNYKILQIR